jgi:hypothetical protein
LKAFYPKRIKVLSLLLNIRGAKITLYKLGTKLEMVVSVEINEGICCYIKALKEEISLTRSRGMGF